MACSCLVCLFLLSTSYCLLSKTVKTKIYKTAVLTVLSAMYECVTWFLTFKEGHDLQVSKKNCLGKYLDLRGINLVGNLGKVITLCILIILLKVLLSNDIRWAWYLARKGTHGTLTYILWWSLLVNVYLEDRE